MLLHCHYTIVFINAQDRDFPRNTIILKREGGGHNLAPRLYSHILFNSSRYMYMYIHNENSVFTNFTIIHGTTESDQQNNSFVLKIGGVAGETVTIILNSFTWCGCRV